MRAIQYDCSRDDWPGKQWHNVQHVDPSARVFLFHIRCIHFYKRKPVSAGIQLLFSPL